MRKVIYEVVEYKNKKFFWHKVFRNYYEAKRLVIKLKEYQENAVACYGKDRAPKMSYEINRYVGRGVK